MRAGSVHPTLPAPGLGFHTTTNQNKVVTGQRAPLWGPAGLWLSSMEGKAQGSTHENQEEES